MEPEEFCSNEMELDGHNKLAEYMRIVKDLEYAEQPDYLRLRGLFQEFLAH